MVVNHASMVHRDEKDNVDELRDPGNEDEAFICQCRHCGECSQNDRRSVEDGTSDAVMDRQPQRAIFMWD